MNAICSPSLLAVLIHHSGLLDVFYDFARLHVRVPDQLALGAVAVASVLVMVVVFSTRGTVAEGECNAIEEKDAELDDALTSDEERELEWVVAFLTSTDLDSPPSSPPTSLPTAIPVDHTLDPLTPIARPRLQIPPTNTSSRATLPQTQVPHVANNPNPRVVPQLARNLLQSGVSRVASEAELRIIDKWARILGVIPGTDAGGEGEDDRGYVAIELDDLAAVEAVDRAVVKPKQKMWRGMRWGGAKYS